MFTQREANQIFAHIPSRTLRQWGLDGLYQWVAETEDARGTKRDYELLNLYQIGLVEVLSRANFPVHRLQELMKHFFTEENFPKKEIAIGQNKDIVLNKFDGYLVCGESLFLTKSRQYFSITRDKKEMRLPIRDDPLLSKTMILTIVDLEEIKKRVDSFIAQVK